MIVAGVLFLPAMSDLLLGNVTIVLTALALIAIRTDRIGAGVAFGVALAAVPKPLFIPLLLWMVAYRRQIAHRARSRAGWRRASSAS